MWNQNYKHAVKFKSIYCLHIAQFKAHGTIFRINVSYNLKTLPRKLKFQINVAKDCNEILSWANSVLDCTACSHFLFLGLFIYSIYKNFNKQNSFKSKITSFLWKLNELIPYPAQFKTCVAFL